MENLLVKLMVLVALAQLGINAGMLIGKHSREELQIFEKRSRDVLKIDWKPISVFPEEARRFR